MAERDRETSLWSWMKEGLLKVDGRKHVHRVEDGTKTGTPDVEGCIDGGAFWMELKVAHEQRTLGTITLPHFTARQAYFLLKRAKAGGRSWLLVRVGQGAQRLHFLIRGSDCEELLGQRVTLTRLRELCAVDPSARAPAIWAAAAR